MATAAGFRIERRTRAHVYGITPLSRFFASRPFRAAAAPALALGLATEAPAQNFVAVTDSTNELVAASVSGGLIDRNIGKIMQAKAVRRDWRSLFEFVRQ